MLAVSGPNILSKIEVPASEIFVIAYARSLKPTHTLDGGFEHPLPISIFIKVRASLRLVVFNKTAFRILSIIDLFEDDHSHGNTLLMTISGKSYAEI